MLTPSRITLIVGLICWSAAVVHSIVGFTPLYQAIQDQALATSEADSTGSVYWEMWTHVFWIGLGMIMSALGGLAIGWSMARSKTETRSRSGKIRNILTESGRIRPEAAGKAGFGRAKAQPEPQPEPQPQPQPESQLEPQSEPQPQR